MKVSKPWYILKNVSGTFFTLLFALLACAAAFGWGMNIAVILRMDPPIFQLVIRFIGIILWPIGSILGYL